MKKEDKLTEEKIFNAATEEFEEKGMAGARMQDIANRAGINKALLHYYFRTKDKLFEAVFDKLAQKMFKKFSAVFEQDLPLEEKISFFFREHMTFLQKNPKLPMFILREVNRNPELLQKFLNNIDFDKIKTGMRKNVGDNIPEKEIAHLMVSIVSLSVFPFVAMPIIEGILKLQGINYKDFVEERKEYSTRFILNAVNSIEHNIDKEKK